MAESLAAYYRTSLEDFNRAHGLSEQSQSIGNQRTCPLPIWMARHSRTVCMRP